MKATKITYWISTSLFFIFDGVLPAFTSQTQPAVEAIRHLGYPDYFRVMLTFFKVAGALALILPFVKGNWKEWAYAGFTFSLIAAFVSNVCVDGFASTALFPIIAMAVLAVSYITYHKLHAGKPLIKI
jgi:uncharacterized membrane protein YjjP (DUF1212 family)